MDWATRKQQERMLSYFGNGETFIFTLSPMSRKYDWVGKVLKEKTPAGAELFLAADMTTIHIGGGWVPYEQS